MVISTSISLARQSIPARASVASVYATTRNPFTGQPARVHVLAVRLIRDVTPVYTEIADVRTLGAISSFSVPLGDLKNLSAFVNLEV